MADKRSINIDFEGIGIGCFFLMCLGGCWVKNHYAYKQEELRSGRVRVQIERVDDVGPTPSEQEGSE